MGREVFRYDEIDSNDFVRVNQSALTIQFFHTATYTTAGGTSQTVPVAELGGLTNGDSVYVGTDNFVIQSGASTTGSGSIVTAGSSIVFANNDAVVVHTAAGGTPEATWYDDPDFTTGVTTAITMDTATNEAVVFLKPGWYGIVIKSGGTVVRVDYHEVVEELDWVTVPPGHLSASAGILESITRLNATTGGTVYIPPGTYNVTGRILITENNIRLLGAGRDKTILKFPSGTDLSGNGMLHFTGDNCEVADLTVDGNNDNNSNATSGINCVGVTDFMVRDCTIKNTTGRGINFPATAAANTRVTIRDNYLTNIDGRGIFLTFGVRCKIQDNVVERTNHNAIEIFKGTTQNTDYTRDTQITGNLVDRSSAASTSNVTYIGFLCAIGSGSRNITVDGNVFNDNTSGGAGTDGIGWGDSGGEEWRNIVISNNVVSNTGTFGIDVMRDTVITGNVIHNAGTHGIRLAGTSAPTDTKGCIISNNVIVDANASGAGSGIHGISIGLHGSGTATMNDVTISGNIVRDERGTRQCHHGIGIGNVSGTNAINRLIITGNILEDVLTSSFQWPTTLVTTTQIRLRDNITKSSDPYSGEATLVAGTKTVTNSNWIDFATSSTTGMAFTPMFLVTRVDDNGGSAGQLEAKWNATDDDLDITSYTEGTITMIDESVGKALPAADAATYALVTNIPGASTDGYEIPSSTATVVSCYIRLGAISSGGTDTIDYFIEDGASTKMTDSLTITDGTDDNTWVRLVGNSVAGASGQVIRIVGEGETGAVSSVAGDQVILTLSDPRINVSDKSKVYWEFIGTAT